MSDTSNSTASTNIVERLANTGIGLGMAAIIGVFTALGIRGDLLARMLRNQPRWTTIAFVLALAGVVAGLVGAVLTGRRKGQPVIFGLGVTLLCVGAGVAIWVGVSSLGVRDQPTLSITPITVTPTSATDSTPSTVAVRITASGSFLASRDRMFLRVGGFPDGVTTRAVWDACSSTANPALALKGGDVLAAGESGPSTTGTTSNTLTLRVSTKSYRYICSHAVLSEQRDGATDGRWVTTLFDLKSIGLDSTGSTSANPGSS